MIPTIDQLYESGYLSDLDFHFARSVGRIAGEGDPVALLAAALASRYTGQGHVCVDLKRMAGSPVVTAGGEAVSGFRWPDLDVWMRSLSRSPLVVASATTAPVVLDRGDRLYLARYWQYQQRLLFQLRQRSAWPVEDVNLPLLTRGLDRLFPRAFSDTAPDHQRLAAQTSVMRHFTIVAGGPGTGNTHTVVYILLLIIEQALSVKREMPRILLAAPTGKAAARLK